MKVAVWDAYVQKKDGSTMHFDIIVPDTITNDATIYTMGREYLKTKQQEGQPLSAKECQFCHMEAATPQIEAAISKNGYFILEMENCN